MRDCLFLLFLFSFLLNVKSLKLVPQSPQESHQILDSDHDIMGKLEQHAPVYVGFELSHDIKGGIILQWQILSVEKETDLVFASSDSITGHYSSADPCCGSVAYFEFFIAPWNKSYNFVFKNDLVPKTDQLSNHDAQSIAHANVTISYENWIFLSVQGLVLDGRTHVLPLFNTTVKFSKSRRLRSLQTAPAPDKPGASGGERTLAPFTLAPRPPRPPTQTVPAPAQAPIPPQQAPNQGSPVQAPQQTPPSQGTPPQSPPSQGTPPQSPPTQGAPQQAPSQGAPQQAPSQGTPPQSPPSQGAPQQAPSQGAPQQAPSQGTPQQVPSQGAPQQAPSQGVPQQTPQPIAQQDPQLVPQQTLVPGNGGDTTSSTPPIAFTGTKPPSFFSEISSAPSLSPVPCLSTTNGLVPFEDKYIAVELPGGDFAMDNADVVLGDIVDAYNAVAACNQEGAFRLMDQAFLVRVNEGALSGSNVEWIIRLTGMCDGCIQSAEALFRPVNSNLTVDLTSLPGVNTTNGTILAEDEPCFCPGPLLLAFQEEFEKNMQQANMTSTIPLKVVDLDYNDSCNTTIVQEDIAPEEHIAVVTLVVTRDPSDMTETETQLMLERFMDVVQSYLSLTNLTCDLSRKRILDVKPNPQSPTILGRKLRRAGSSANIHTRMVQQSSVDFELVVDVTFTCFGCQGRLFGQTNFTPSNDCLCPTDTVRFGVDEKEILPPLNNGLGRLSIDQSVSDIIEIVPVPCSSIVNDFSTVVVIEYRLKSNETKPTEDDLTTLEDQFVAGYNGMARRYCDPYFRRIRSAETFSDYEISEDGWRLNVEMSIIGTCRGNCSSDIPIYDPDAFMVSLGMSVSGSNTSRTTRSTQINRQRHLQMEEDSICHCSVAANKDLGPSEPDIVQNFGGLVDKLALESILDVAECKPLTFQTGIFLTVPATLGNATQDELDQIGQTFLNSYNQQIQQAGFCDEYFRKLVDYRVDGNPAVKSSFSVRALGEEQMSKGRKLLTRTIFRPKRRTQAVESDGPTFAPTSAPSSNSSSNSTFILNNNTSLFLQVSGVCQGCSMDLGLFDQVSARRSLQDSIVNATSAKREDSCFCPPKSQRVQLSGEAVTQALSSLVNGDVGINEVDIVECSVEVNTFDTSVPLDFLVNGAIAQGDEAIIAAGFITTYIRLSEQYCDSLFRRPEEVFSTRTEILSGPDQNGVTTVRFWLDFRGTCRGCTGSEALFDRSRRRMQEDEVVCFCEKSTIPRAPSDEEFQSAFATYLGSGRRRLQLSKFTLLCVASTCGVIVPSVTDVPSMSPSTILLVNPAGVQNFAGCVVPNSLFIGDGYCDWDVDATGEPIYNNAACGYDGGDCCESTCQDFRVVCGSSGQYWCLDPNAPDTGTVAPAVVLTCAEQAGALLGNGVCNLELNLPFCNYDEGDCCESTCGVLNGVSCVGPFRNCVDPIALLNAPSTRPSSTSSSSPSSRPSTRPSTSPSRRPSTAPVPVPAPTPGPTATPGRPTMSPSAKPSRAPSSKPSSVPSRVPSSKPSGTPSRAPSSKPSSVPSKAPSPAPFIVLPPSTIMCRNSLSCPASFRCGDGWCDNDLNREECGWDGGDCCFETCVNDEPNDVACASGQLICKDPNYRKPIPESCSSLVPDVDRVGDGFCDSVGFYNTPECNYDGGDCCQDSCIGNCQEGSFDCIRDLIPPECNATLPFFLGDGYCDAGVTYNSKDCGWDLGDCCPDTCKSTEFYICGFSSPYTCYDLSSKFAVTRPSIPTGCPVIGTDQDRLGDGRCDDDEIFNSAACGWDMGDCCLETCLKATWFQPFECDFDVVSTYSTCRDPQVQRRPDVPLNCNVSNPEWLGDGWCDDYEYDDLIDVFPYNTEACGWDLGDCCSGSCENSAWYKPITCGEFGLGYKCRDPNGSTTSRTDPPGLQKVELFKNPSVYLPRGVSGTYTASAAASLFGQLVYYNANYMIYWCQEGNHWTIQSITSIQSLATFGCLGQGYASATSNEPGRLCDAVWTMQGTSAFLIASDDCPLPLSTPPVTPGIAIDVLANPARYYYNFLSGTYVGSSDSVFGVSVYYLALGAILYWCEPSSQWFVDPYFGGGDIALIPYFGCTGDPSNQVSGPDVSFCDVTWPDIITFTIDCPKNPSSQPTTAPGADVQVVGNPETLGQFYSGTYMGSQTDFVYGVSVYYNFLDDSMIYWCGSTLQWYISEIFDVESIPYFGCVGWPSLEIPDGPGQLCKAIWEEVAGTLALLLFSSDCPSSIPISPPTGTSFEVAVLPFGPMVCEGIYVERGEKTLTGGLIFSNGPCIIYGFDDGLQTNWEVASIFDLDVVIMTGMTVNGYENSTIAGEFPCSAKFETLVFCSPDCPSSYTAASPAATLDTSIGKFEESTTMIDGAPVWFSCFGSFEFSSADSNWAFTSTTNVELGTSNVVTSSDICEAEWYGIITIVCADLSEPPSQVPSDQPSSSVAPSRTPSKEPSVTPSNIPSKAPSVTPSRTPSTAPSVTPSNTPSKAPSVTPSNTPSRAPSKTPTKPPTNAPSKTPSNAPSKTPSKGPII